MLQIPWLDDNPNNFPSVDSALTDPDGLLAAGGDLSPQRLIAAYQLGIFPWYETGQPILWWTPNPRTILLPKNLHVSRSLNKLICKDPFEVTFNQAFEQVVHHCSTRTDTSVGTWITAEMQEAYIKLHELGYAHSVEAWEGSKLVGGLYGVGLGKIFFGESMFSLVSNASKVAFVTWVKILQRHNVELIDCQIESEHLSRFGATQIDRKIFSELLKQHISPEPAKLLIT